MKKPPRVIRGLSAGAVAAAVIAGSATFGAAAADADDLDFSVSGSTNHGGFTTSGKSPVRIEDALSTLQVVTPADGTTVANRSPYFMGWGTPGATVTVVDDRDGTTVVDTEVDGNGWWGQVSSSERAAGEHVFTITQTTDAGATQSIRRTLTISTIRTLTVDAPVSGSTAWWPVPTLIGWGTPGGSVRITDEDGDELGSETINPDGWFGVRSSKSLANGAHTLTFTQTAEGLSNSTDVPITIAPKAFQIDSPVHDGSSDWASPAYIGWATPNAAIEVRDSDDTTVLARGSANAEGWFGFPSASDLAFGPHTLHFRQTWNGTTTEVTSQYTILGAPPLRIEAPAEGQSSAWAKPSYIGWAVPGSKVRVEDSDGSEIVVIDANSEGWFGQVSPTELRVGDHTLTFTQVIGEVDINSTQVHIEILS